MNAELAHLLSSRRKCRCCGAEFAQLMYLEYDRPDICPPDLPMMDNSAWLVDRSGDLLTEDFCRLGESHFLRASLVFGLIGGVRDFTLSVWASVQPADFDRYFDSLDEVQPDIGEPIPALIVNAVPPEDALPVQALLHLMPNFQRPELEITDPDSPLFHMQQEGLELADMVAMLEAYGHDKPSLLYDA